MNLLHSSMSWASSRRSERTSGLNRKSRISDWFHWVTCLWSDFLVSGHHPSLIWRLRLDLAPKTMYLALENMFSYFLHKELQISDWFGCLRRSCRSGNIFLFVELHFKRLRLNLRPKTVYLAMRNEGATLEPPQGTRRNFETMHLLLPCRQTRVCSSIMY